VRKAAKGFTAFGLSAKKSPGQGSSCPQNQKNQTKKKYEISLNGGIKMKKLTVIALIAIMLIGMLAFAACKAKEEVTEEVTDTTLVEETTMDTAVVDTTVVPAPVQ
jgi:hypothetical protein